MINGFLGSVMRLASPRQAARRAVVAFTQRHYPNLARFHRRRLNGVCFVGITGSCGKTTTKDLAAAVLSARGEGVKGTQLFNRIQHVSRTVLSVRPSHSFCVEEIGASDPGMLARSALLFAPHIAVVTMIGWDHFKSYRSVEAIAAEKVALVEALPPDGTAVLNVDDPLVWAMRENTTARVLGYGLGEEAALRAEQVSAVWPDRLSFTVVYGDQRRKVQTQLLGERPVHSVLAALGVGLASGIALEECIRRIESVEPAFARMSPYTTDDGVTFIVDTWKAPFYSLPDAIDFMRNARADRKLMVFGTFSDYRGSASSKYRKVARESLEFADKVIFNCPLNASVLKERNEENEGKLLTFETTYEVSRYLDGELKPGDLVMLKCSSANHHERLLMDRMALAGSILDREADSNRVSCWREHCGLFKPCMFCDKRDDDVVPLLS